MLKTIRCGPGEPFTAATHSRREPEPESLVLVTVKVAASAGVAARQRRIASATQCITGVLLVREGPGSLHPRTVTTKRNRAAAAKPPRLDRWKVFTDD